MEKWGSFSSPQTGSTGRRQASSVLHGAEIEQSEVRISLNFAIERHLPRANVPRCCAACGHTVRVRRVHTDDLAAAVTRDHVDGYRVLILGETAEEGAADGSSGRTRSRSSPRRASGARFSGGRVSGRIRLRSAHSERADVARQPPPIERDLRKRSAQSSAVHRKNPDEAHISSTRSVTATWCESVNRSDCAARPP